MRTLVAISSCESFEVSGLNDPLRNTWLPEAVRLGMDYRFFHGAGATPKQDVVVLNVVDELYGLTEKLKGKLRWAVEHEYDCVFSVFPDTYACPERILEALKLQADYLGNVYQFPGSASFCQGGPGYLVSSRACAMAHSSSSSYLNDDAWLGDVLNAGGIKPVHHAGFTAFGPGPLRTNGAISNHLSTQPGGYVGTNMYEGHKRWLASL
jgi:hypothetical protein